MQIILPVGKQIRAIRRHLECTQKEVAKAVGVSISHLSDVERGTDSPTYKLVDNIATFFETYGYKVNRYNLVVATDISRGKVPLDDLSLEHKLLVATLANVTLTKDQSSQLWKLLEEMNNV